MNEANRIVNVDRKIRLKLSPRTLPKQPPADRIHNWGETSLPLDLETARFEASRCIQCPAAPCTQACPVHNDIAGALWLLENGDVAGAADHYRLTSNLPEMCGRLCPQERLCEGHCVVGKNSKPVPIGKLEAFVSDYQRQHSGLPKPAVALGTGRSVAIVGAGPAGIVAAEELAIRGHAVTVYDAWPRPGGVLLYGIPSFKMSKSLLDAKIDQLRSLGVRFVPGRQVDAVAIEDLRRSSDAVLIAHGASLPTRLGIPGENLPGVYSATEFLVRANLDETSLPEGMPVLREVGRRVLVIGGGDTSMDCARTAVRLGAEKVTLVYRRGEAEMRCREEEKRNAREEGVEFQFLTVPLLFLMGEEGRVSGARCQRCILGDPDESGRQSFVPVRGSNFVLEADTIVVAVGYRVDDSFSERTGLQVDRSGRIAVNSETMEANVPGVFAAGDAVRGADLVVTAMADGRRAAHAIDKALAARMKTAVSATAGG